MRKPKRNNNDLYKFARQSGNGEKKVLDYMRENGFSSSSIQIFLGEMYWGIDDRGVCFSHSELLRRD